MRKVVSARGEVVNFDLLQIKQQIANAPKPIIVQARESFVDQRTKRRARRPAPTAESATRDTAIVDTQGDQTNVAPVDSTEE